MDNPKEEQPSNKVDEDSGIENASDSGHSGDETSPPQQSDNSTKNNSNDSTRNNTENILRSNTVDSTRNNTDNITRHNTIDSTRNNTDNTPKNVTIDSTKNNAENIPKSVTIDSTKNNADNIPRSNTVDSTKNTTDNSQKTDSSEEKKLKSADEVEKNITPSMMYKFSIQGSIDESIPETSKVLAKYSFGLPENHECAILNYIQKNGNISGSDYNENLQFYTLLKSGQTETLDFSINSKSKKPQWLDEEKFKRGQKFARKHFFCLNFAEMISLYMLFSQRSTLDALIYTGMSDSPYRAFLRYVNTVAKLSSWYEDDIWNNDTCLGKKNLKVVREMHKTVFKTLTTTAEKELTTKTTLGDPESTALWCPLQGIIKYDFRDSVPKRCCDFELKSSQGRVWINQTDMSITQFGFVGLAVTYPKSFGIHRATDDDLDDFLHLWRGLGFLLGIKDEHNFCNGNLSAVRFRTRFLIELLVKPSLREVTCDWEHMCRCLAAGIAYYLPIVSFESSFLFLCNLLGIRTPRLRKQISFNDYITFLLHKFVFFLMRLPGVLYFFNTKLHNTLRKVGSMSPAELGSWEDREFAYMHQPGKRAIRSPPEIEKPRENIVRSEIKITMSHSKKQAFK